jgi:hypothetical protein
MVILHGDTPWYTLTSSDIHVEWIGLATHCVCAANENEDEDRSHIKTYSFSLGKSLPPALSVGFGC